MVTKSKTKTIIHKSLIIISFLLTLLIAARIIHVNASFERADIGYYYQDQWVELGGSYFRSHDEFTNGYSVMVKEYEILSKQSYFDKYHLDNSSVNEGNPFEYIMEVTVAIQNDENKDGKVQIGDWVLIGKNNDFVAYLDQQLLMDSDERITSIVSSVTTIPGKDIEIKLPFPMIFLDDAAEVDTNAPYKLAVTKYPVRNYIILENTE